MTKPAKYKFLNDRRKQFFTCPNTLNKRHALQHKYKDSNTLPMPTGKKSWLSKYVVTLDIYKFVAPSGLFSINV